MTSLIEKLPKVAGVYRQNVNLAKINWFNIGGPAEVVFRPADEEDLCLFLREKPSEVPVTIIGVGSNLLVRDGGIDGVVIRLGRGFTEMAANGEIITAGSGALDGNVALFAEQKGISGLEFLSGIPGTIGGALAMNAGAYGSDMASILIEAIAVDPKGVKQIIPAEKMGFSYRKNSIPKGWIFIGAKMRGQFADPQKIAAKMQEIAKNREAAQPIRERTSGSTFKNPPSHKAWQLIDEAGCRGLKIGGAMVSVKHCNFFINSGDATAADMENLMREVIKRVHDKSGITLELEVQVIGKEK